MNKGFVLSIFQEYVATFMDDDPDAFNEKRLTDDLARDSTSDNENIDEILLYGASSAGAVRITEFLLSLGVKVFNLYVLFFLFVLFFVLNTIF